MIKDIRFGGMATVPDDYSAKDGEMALSMNMLNERGGLEVTGKPKELLQLENGEKVVYIHKNAGYEHWIRQKGNVLSYYDRKKGVTNGMLDSLFAWKPNSPYYGWQRKYVEYYEWQGGKTVLYGCVSRLYGWRAQGEMHEWLDSKNLKSLYTDSETAYEDMMLFDGERNAQNELEITSCGRDGQGNQYFVVGEDTYYLTKNMLAWEKEIYTGVEAPGRGSRLYYADGTYSGYTILVTIGKNIIIHQADRYFRHSELDKEPEVLYTTEEAPVQGDILYDAAGEDTHKTIMEFTADGMIDSAGRLRQMDPAYDIKNSVTVYTKSKEPDEGDTIYIYDNGSYTEYGDVNLYKDGHLYTSFGAYCEATDNDVMATETVYTKKELPVKDDIIYKKNGSEYEDSGATVSKVAESVITTSGNLEYLRDADSDEYTGATVYNKTDSDELTDGQKVYDSNGKETSDEVTAENKVNGVPYRKYPEGNISSIPDDEVIERVAGIGNIIIIVTDKHMHYCLWKEADYDTEKAYYHYLGNKLPVPEVDFTDRYIFEKDGSFEKKTPHGGGGFSRTGNVAFGPDLMRSDRMKIQQYIDMPTRDHQISVIRDDDDKGAEKRQKLTDLVLGKVNKLLADATEQGLFVLPRLIRIALKLYDGNEYVNYSEPFLVCGHDVSSGVWGTTGFQNAVIRPYILRYFIRNIDTLLQWKDIIKEIAVFASEPIYDYDQSGSVEECRYDGGFIRVKLPEISMAEQVRKLESTFNFYKIYSIELEKYHPCYSVLRLTKTDFRAIDSEGQIIFLLEYYDEQGRRQTARPTYQISAGQDISSIAEGLRKLFSSYGISVYRTLDQKQYMNDGMTDVLSEICLVSDNGDVELMVQAISIKNMRFTYNIKVMYGGMLIPELLPLKTLTQQTSISDDYFARCELMPKVMYQYNGRMNYANLKRKVYSPVLCRCYTAPYYGNALTEIEAMFFYISTGEREVIVKAEAKGFFDLNYIYYPDKRCHRCVVRTKHATLEVEGGKTVYYSFPMSANDFMNGATFVDVLPTSRLYPETEMTDLRSKLDFDPSRYIDTSITENPAVTDDVWEELPRTVINSEAGNPFSWTARGYKDVGGEEITALSSATVAMSQGQFGQYPVYAFCKDGVFSLDIDKDGYYTFVTPTTRDVAYEGSVRQTDDAVVFACRRGLMLLSGKTAMLLSEKIENALFPFGSLPGWDVISDSDMGDVPKDIVDFKEYLQGCRIVYSYAQQRLYVIHPDKTHAWIYSLQSREWGMCQSDLTEPLNSYPECLVMDRNHRVVDMDDMEYGEGKNFLLTRPLKIDMADVLKTTDSVIMRGRFRKGKVRSILYGSRDLINWKLIWSSQNHYLRGMHGTPYKYYIIALICADMDAGEMVDGCTVRFAPRQTNQPR